MKLSDVSKGPRHTILGSFALIPPDIPRLLIIGETGIGKSTFCNKMAGIYYKLIVAEDGDSDSSSCDSDNGDDDDGDDVKNTNSKNSISNNKEPKIVCQEQKEIFESGSDQYSITQTTSWAQVM